MEVCGLPKPAGGGVTELVLSVFDRNVGSALSCHGFGINDAGLQVFDSDFQIPLDTNMGLQSLIPVNHAGIMTATFFTIRCAIPALQNGQASHVMGIRIDN